jgi:hypothetical protein
MIFKLQINYIKLYINRKIVSCVTVLVHFDDVTLIWINVHIEIFLPLFCQFHKLLHSHLFVQFDLTRVWRTRATCFGDTYILGQNVCPDLNIQHEQIISPLQGRNEGRHIVLIGLFLLLILFILKQSCSGCNSFILWYKLVIFDLKVYYHKMACHVSSRPSFDLDFRSQGEIIDFRRSVVSLL